MSDKTMTKKKSRLERLSSLTWNDLADWAGGSIVSRGKTYQRQGRVSDLTVTDDGSLVGWVDGSKRYACKVDIDADGQIDSTCTCPDMFDCKHGVSMVLECLEELKKNRIIPEIKTDDERLAMLLGKECSGDSGTKNLSQDFDSFLKGKSKDQLVDLIYDLARQFPEMAKEVSERQQLISGKSEVLVLSLRKEIEAVSGEYCWGNHWDDNGFTPDYSGILRKLEGLLKSGYIDELLGLGHELIVAGSRQVEESNDEGETAMEVESCMPVIVEALVRSTLDEVDKLVWALDVVLDDQVDLCREFGKYLHQEHPQSAWDRIADMLMKRLHEFSRTGEILDYKRDQLTNWTIHALEQAGRQVEIIQLCEIEARQTCSYGRLIKLLIKEQRYADAECWIQEGIQVTKEKWPGIAARLRTNFLEIHTLKENWPVVAAGQVEEYVRRPSRQAFNECKQASDKAKVWVMVHKTILSYLENGALPWMQASWSLPESGLTQPEAASKNEFPLFGDLIDIAIFEEKPDQVLRWYDQRSTGNHKYGIEEGSIAGAVQTYAPERAVTIWKDIAERLIARVKPRAYQEASRYLRKAAEVMRREQKLKEWERYLRRLREEHIRKRRLIEILDGLDGKPIMGKGVQP